MADHTGAWQPLTIPELVTVMAQVEAPWWIAGGWTVDLHVGRQTRDHDDIDVLVMRPDIAAVRRAVPTWDLHLADPPGTLRPWAADEELPDRVIDIWCRRTTSDPWQLQLMVNDTDGPDWVYRRDPRVRRNRKELDGPASTPGLPVLAPEVQLVYKSKDPRPKDNADFTTLTPALSDEQSRWLREALLVTSPGHPWLEGLRR